jgi:hypothetical protein
VYNVFIFDLFFSKEENMKMSIFFAIICALVLLMGACGSAPAAAEPVVAETVVEDLEAVVEGDEIPAE